MIVESKAGGVDIYSDPDLNSTKLNDSLIPNGTALRIEGEVEDEKDKGLWGYTQYHGMYGYVPEAELKPAQSRQEAIDAELYIAGSDNVDYNTDYDVTVDSDEDGIHLYQGPGEKYGAGSRNRRDKKRRNPAHRTGGGNGGRKPLGSDRLPGKRRLGKPG